MAKIYTVIKDGEELKELKTLPAAKKLADAESAEVWCEGKPIYTPVEAKAEAVDEESEPVTEPDKYTLTARMNVRTAPSLDATKLAVAQAGTVVDVTAIENDWLHLADGTFILYEGGKFAKKND